MRKSGPNGVKGRRKITVGQHDYVIELRSEAIWLFRKKAHSAKVLPLASLVIMANRGVLPIFDGIDIVSEKRKVRVRR